MATERKRTAFLIKYRFWFLLAGIFLFLPPLSFLFQFTADHNFCGTWCPRMFFVWRAGTDLNHYLAGFARSYMGVILVLSILLITVFFGRLWCSHLCPIGGAMELGSRLVPSKFKINYSKVPAPSFRYGYFLVYMLAPALGIGSLCCRYCNFAAIPRLFGAPFSSADLSYFLRTAGLINLGLVLVFGFFAAGGRAYCNLLCPIGAIDAFVNKISSSFGKRVRIDNEKCTKCGLCVDVCPTWAIKINERAEIDQLSCIPCRKCEKICPVGAIYYGKPEG